MKKNDIFFRIICFLSAFLLFSAEPLIIKYLLPYFGGSSSVWIVGSLFFQGVLLLGYLYSFLVLKFKQKLVSLLHLFFVIMSIVIGFSLTGNWGVPILPPDTLIYPLLKNPTGGVLLILAFALGLPFLLLSTTGTLLQSIYMRLFKKEPFFLYRISNAGSLLGLISYPFIIEPFIPLKVQGSLWYKGFLLNSLTLIGLCFFLLFKKISKPKTKKTVGKDKKPYFIWIFFAMIPVITTLAVTNHLTQGVSPVPFLWILPLALYLTSFIAGFRSRKYLYEYASFAAFSSSILIVPIRSFDFLNSSILPIQGIFYLIYLFFTGLFCHNILYKYRPKENNLGSFYLSLTFGGFLGGLFAAVIAPYIFKTFFELEITILISLIISSFAVLRILSTIQDDPLFTKKITRLIKVAVFICILSVLVPVVPANYRILYQSRNFYGILRVAEQNGLRMLSNGSILHGAQYTDEDKKFQPTTYYLNGSGVETAERLKQHDKNTNRVAAIGLGTGTVSIYCRENDYYDFYEINPEVISIAKTYFSFLSNCKNINLIEGDARIQFEKRYTGVKYDLVILDAFNDDAIPVHLLTKEAFELYLRNLDPEGIIAVHISNRNLDLNPPLLRIAGELSLKWVNIPADWSIKTSVRSSPSEWVLMSFRDSLFKEVKEIRSDAISQNNFKEGDLWTDDFSSILPIININPFRRKTSE